MHDLLRDIPLFVEIARKKSFSQAADALEMPVSTLSRRMSKMEKSLGVPLLLRNSRKVELTESGRILYERCDGIVAETREAVEAALHNMQTPTGKVRFSVPGDIFHNYLVDALCEFAHTWPDIQLHIHFSERWVDLINEPFDLELRLGDLPDSTLLARKLGTGSPYLYASPKLLDRFPLPQEPADLARIPCLNLNWLGNLWTLSRDGKSQTVPVRAAHVLNSMSACLRLAVGGLGVAMLPPPSAERYEKTGELIRVLEGWDLPSGSAYLVMASRQVPHRVRLLIEHLVKHFSTLQTKYPE